MLERCKKKLEMKADVKIQGRWFRFSLTVLHLVLIIACISVAAPLIGYTNSFCNATIGECHEETMYVESDVCSIPQFSSQQTRYISYGSFGRQPICNGRIYGNCLRPAGSNKSRSCTYYTRCRVVR
ncbi:hypothetical protein P3X46_016331 [Hevea brasiliensis]|uniref:Uncharacterized protein n=1 Tax=Hevea brasiliensis TaxID=3981 RepID=A0ABQ9LYR9_HEVBR|nr:hypothetical protein P3X46_016331 [Hevea brasiliensis]